MIRAAFCALLFAATSATGDAASPAEAAPNAPAVSVATLGNGLRVVAVEDPAAPVVSTAMWYRFGANDERAGQAGLAHALAHLMFDGTTNLSATALDDVIARYGAKASATTGNDFTVYRFTIPADKLELALRIEADRMTHLTFDAQTWARERHALLAEDEFDLAAPLAHLYHDVCAAASSRPVCALSALGDPQAIRNASADDVRSYYRERYAPDDATLVVSGDVTGAAVFALARAVFGDVPRAAPPAAAGVAPDFAEGKAIELAGDLPEEIVDLAFQAPGSEDPGSDAFAVIDEIINDPLSDFHKGLVRSGYAAGYSTQLDRNLHGGLYHVFLIAAPGHTGAQVRDAFLEIMDTARAGGFSEDLIRAAKLSLSRKNTFARDSIAALGERIGTLAAFDDSISFDESDARTNRVDERGLQAAAQRYFAEPAVTGTLRAAPGNTASDSATPPTSVTDDFTRRAPEGAFVESRSFRELTTAPMTLTSQLHPESFALSNGLRVIVQSEPQSPTVFIDGAVRTSTAFDPPGKEGEGALLSALLDDGSASLDADARRHLLDDLGATLDLGFTFGAHGLARDTDRLLDVIADALRNPALRTSDFDAVRKQTIDALTQRERDPAERADAEFSRALFAAGDPERREPSAASLGAVTAADVRRFAARYVRPDLTVITIAGDVDPGAVRAEMTRAFGSWTASGPAPDLDPGRIPRVVPRRRTVIDDAPYAHERLGTAGVAIGSADYPALDVLGQILGAGGGFDTRLVAELRTRRHLVYRASTTVASGRYRGTFEIDLTGDAKHMAGAVAGTRAVLDRLRSDPVGPAEIDRARTKIVAGGFVSEESTQVVAARLEALGLDALPLDDELTLPARYASVDGADLMRAATTYLRSDAFVDVYEGPTP